MVTRKSIGFGTISPSLVQKRGGKMSKNSSPSLSIRAILFLLNLLISDEWQRDEGKGQTRKDRAETEKWEGGGGGVGAVTLRDEVDGEREGKSSFLPNRPVLLLLHQPSFPLFSLFFPEMVDFGGTNL